MKSDDFDARMRRFETANDVRRASWRVHDRPPRRPRLYAPDQGTPRFRKAFDATFRDHMIATAQHLMSSGFRVLYAHTQSDEISLLFNHDDELFDRKLRKLHSILAAEASACFSLALGGVATFDYRISQLPTQDLMIDYFRWRHADASRNALNTHSYWACLAAPPPRRPLCLPGMACTSPSCPTGRSAAWDFSTTRLRSKAAIRKQARSPRSSAVRSGLNSTCQ